MSALTDLYRRKVEWSLATFGKRDSDKITQLLRANIDEILINVANVDLVKRRIKDICLLAIDLFCISGGDAEAFDACTSSRFSRIPPVSAAIYIREKLTLPIPYSGEVPVISPRETAVFVWNTAFSSISCDLDAIERRFWELQLQYPVSIDHREPASTTAPATDDAFRMAVVTAIHDLRAEATALVSSLSSLLGIIDRTGGYMTTEDQERIRSARSLLREKGSKTNLTREQVSEWIDSIPQGVS